MSKPVLHAPILACVLTTTLLAIDGPGVQRITDGDWGTNDDLYPHVVRLELDRDGDGDFELTSMGSTDTWGTGTLVAPDVIATAGHIFNNFTPAIAPNSPIPAGRVRIRYGNGANDFVTNDGGMTRQMVFKVANDFAFVTISANDSIPRSQPIAVLRRAPRVNDVNFAVGFGTTWANNAGPANPRRTVNDPHGIPRHFDAAKNWSSIVVDNVTPDFVEQVIASPEDWTEGGDSGGPGQVFQLDSFPARAYNAKTGSSFKFRDNYLISAVSGGPTPSTQNSANAAAVTYPAANNPDAWTRLDKQAEWLNNDPGAPKSMRPLNVNVFHNLPTSAGDLSDPTAMVKVFWEIRYETANPWLANLALWEEDTAAGDQPMGFAGNWQFGANLGADDLVGYGHSADKLNPNQSIVYAWDWCRVADLIPVVDDFDWQFRVNYGTDYAINVNKVGLNAIDALIQAYTIDFPNAGQRAGFALIPEPVASCPLIVGAALLLRRRFTSLR
jgi:hypothetical protein